MKKITFLLILVVSTTVLFGQTQIGEDIDGEAADDGGGFSVSLSADGSIMAIGAYGNDGNGTSSGHVRVFQNIAGAWVQIGEDIDGEAAGDQSGISVSLSADGSIVAIGANLNGGNGIYSGHVRVFEYKEGDWVQIGEDIDGSAPGDGSGFSVSLSADGTILAIGAVGVDNYGDIDTSGNVRVFNLEATVLGVSSFESTNYTFKIVVNKAAEQLYVYLPEGSDLKTINLYSLNGKHLYTGKSTVLPIQGLSKGLYIVEVVNSQGRTAKKVVVP